MKQKLIVLAVLLTTIVSLKAQRYITYDTIRKHEISASFLPVLNILSGSYSEQKYVNFNLSYKYYFKNKFVLRAALVLFPGKNGLSSGDGIYTYAGTLGVKNIFGLTYSSRSAKTQFNLGVEKIVKVNRLMHSFGAELFVNKWQENSKTNYEYRYIGTNPASNNHIDTTNYAIDSLYTYRNNKYIGVGLQAFYSLRYQIAKRWYLSTTIGPSFSYLFLNSTTYKSGNSQTKNYFMFYDDFNVGFISDISICFRL